ncbi:MAG TPA: hypothetical protein DIT66_01105 [Rhodobiaceae bacterium]|nr:hypothetical protein [Rhodobiaceae bacterium]
MPKMKPTQMTRARTRRTKRTRRTTQSAGKMSSLVARFASILFLPFKALLRVPFKGVSKGFSLVRFAPWRLQFGVLAGVLVLMGVGIFTSELGRPTSDYLRDSFYQATAATGLQVADITVEGRRRTQREDLLTAIDIAPGAPILEVDLTAVQARVKTLPWVQSVSVIRRLPGIIHLHISEREPFALYKDGTKTALIDKSGDVITRKYLKVFAHLPVLSGSGAPIRAQSLMDMLQDYPVVRNRLVAAEWIGGRRWSLTLDHGGAVHLPAKDVQNALNRLMDLERERRILAVEKQSIDLRLPDRILLRPVGKNSRRAPEDLVMEARS